MTTATVLAVVAPIESPPDVRIPHPQAHASTPTQMNANTAATKMRSGNPYGSYMAL